MASQDHAFRATQTLSPATKPQRAAAGVEHCGESLLVADFFAFIGIARLLNPRRDHIPHSSRFKSSILEMVVRIRFARFGRKKLPFYRIYATDSRNRRDGKFLENLGYYNPITGKDGEKQFAIKGERVQYWLSVGAQPSDAVARLLARTGNLPQTYPGVEPKAPAPAAAPTSAPSQPDVAITARLSSAPMVARTLCIC